MKYFYGTIRGSGSKSTNSGTMSSGLRVEAHSKQGTVVIQLSENSGVDHACIYITRNPKTGKGTERIIYNGRVDSVEPDVVLKFPPKPVREVTLPDPEILAPSSEEGALLSIAAAMYDPEIDVRGSPVVMHPVATLPPPQRRTQLVTTGYVDRANLHNARAQTTAISVEQGVQMLLDNYRRHVGELTPAGDEMIVEHQDYDRNEGYEPEPRRPYGKLTLLRDASDD